MRTNGSSAVALPVRLEDLLLFHARLDEDMRRRQHAAHIVHRRGAEMHGRRAPPRASACKTSAVWRWPVGAKLRITPARSGWWVASLACIAAFAGADLDLADHAAASSASCGKERIDRQVGGGGVAADAADAARGAHLLAVQFRQAVDELLQPGRVGVRLAIPAHVIVGVAQAKVGAEVDDALPPARRSARSCCMAPP
jgi:hypothetical protein